MLSELPSVSANAPTISRPRNPTVEIVEGYKRVVYWGRSQEILNSLNISIYEGEIYTVLGPHGCGKSTLVNVILGLEDLNEGTVKVFGFTPGHELSGIPGIRVGYTPKENGLYEDFTIRETFHYYGQLLGLRKAYVLERINILSNLLKIPTSNKYLRNYSEGIKRQLSFAVAIFHEPDLLVLDEPCFGLNPILKRSMWEYMKELTQNNKTIFLTTQNCDEAKWSDKIGFMKNGKILLEGNPKELMEKYKENTLEHLYCRAYISNFDNFEKTQSASVTDHSEITLEPLRIKTSEGFTYVENDLDEKLNIQSQQRIHAIDRRLDSFRKIKEYFLRYKRFHILVKRDFLISIRSYSLLLMFLLLPPVYLLVFSISIGPPPSGISLGVVNYEVAKEECVISKFISCKLLWNIDKHTIIQRSYTSYEDAYNAVRNLELWGILIINKNCEDYFTQKFNLPANEEKNTTLFSSPFILMLDTTSRIIADAIEDAIKDAITNLLIELTDKEEIDHQNNLLEIRESIFGLESTTITEYMAPGLALVFTFHSIAFVLAVAFVNYRIQCITARNYLAGVKIEESVLAHMICFGSFSLLQSFIMFISLFAVLKIINYGNWFCILFLVVIQIGCGLCFGITIGMFSTSTVSSGAWVFGSFLATIMLCGIQWPLESLPHWVRVVVNFLPLTKSAQAVRTVLHRGTSISHSQVWLGIIVPLIWLVIFTICFTYKNRVI